MYNHKSEMLPWGGDAQDALRRAMEDNPDLAKEFEGKLQEKVRRERCTA